MSIRTSYGMDITLKQDLSIYNTFLYPFIMFIIRTGNMSAHIRMVLTNVSLNIPVMHGKAALGIWQAVYLYEHRYMPMRRHVLLHIVGE